MPGRTVRFAPTRLQAAFGAAPLRWSEGRGVGAEWRFRVAPPGEIRRPLVPDVAPTRNASGRTRRIEHKIGVSLAAGASAVIVVDPSDRTVRLPELFKAADRPR